MKTAMILAAGQGTRLRPLTNLIPKALCPLRGQPLIAYHLNHLIKAGFERVIINHAHLGGQIRQWVTSQDFPNLDIHFSPEPPGALETGGGIVQALDLLGDQPFLTLNADIFSDYDLSKICLNQPYMMHAVLVPKPSYRSHGDFGLSANGLLQNQDSSYVFSGIATYHPKFFNQAPSGRYSVSSAIREAALKGLVSAELYSGFWFDIGSAEQWAMAEKLLSNAEF